MGGVVPVKGGISKSRVVVVCNDSPVDFQCGSCPFKSWSSDASGIGG